MGTPFEVHVSVRRPGSPTRLTVDSEAARELLRSAAEVEIVDDAIRDVPGSAVSIGGLGELAFSLAYASRPEILHWLNGNTERVGQTLRWEWEPHEALAQALKAAPGDVVRLVWTTKALTASAQPQPAAPAPGSSAQGQGPSYKLLVEGLEGLPPISKRALSDLLTDYLSAAGAQVKLEHRFYAGGGRVGSVQVSVQTAAEVEALLQHSGTPLSVPDSSDAAVAPVISLAPPPPPSNKRRHRPARNAAPAHLLAGGGAGGGPAPQPPPPQLPVQAAPQPQQPPAQAAPQPPAAPQPQPIQAAPLAPAQLGVQAPPQGAPGAQAQLAAPPQAPALAVRPVDPVGMRLYALSGATTRERSSLQAGMAASQARADPASLARLRRLLNLKPLKAVELVGNRADVTNVPTQLRVELAEEGLMAGGVAVAREAVWLLQRGLLRNVDLWDELLALVADVQALGPLPPAPPALQALPDPNDQAYVLPPLPGHLPVAVQAQPPPAVAQAPAQPAANPLPPPAQAQPQQVAQQPPRLPQAFQAPQPAPTPAQLLTPVLPSAVVPQGLSTLPTGALKTPDEPPCFNVADSETGLTTALVILFVDQRVAGNLLFLKQISTKTQAYANIIQKVADPQATDTVEVLLKLLPAMRGTKRVLTQQHLHDADVFSKLWVPQLAKAGVSVEPAKALAAMQGSVRIFLDVVAAEHPDKAGAARSFSAILTRPTESCIGCGHSQQDPVKKLDVLELPSPLGGISLRSRLLTAQGRSQQTAPSPCKGGCQEALLVQSSDAVVEVRGALKLSILRDPAHPDSAFPSTLRIIDDGCAQMDSRQSCLLWRIAYGALKLAPDLYAPFTRKAQGLAVFYKAHEAVVVEAEGLLRCPSPRLLDVGEPTERRPADPPAPDTHAIFLAYEPSREKAFPELLPFKGSAVSPTGVLEVIPGIRDPAHPLRLLGSGASGYTFGSQLLHMPEAQDNAKEVAVKVLDYLDPSAWRELSVFQDLGRQTGPGQQEAQLRFARLIAAGILHYVPHDSELARVLANAETTGTYAPSNLAYHLASPKLALIMRLYKGSMEEWVGREWAGHSGNPAQAQGSRALLASLPQPWLSVAELAQALRELLSAGHFLHLAGYSHGDLKPENILLEERGQGRPPRFILADFGFAARLPGGPIEEILSANGSALWKPLEFHAGLAAGTEIRQTASADVYATGLIIATLPYWHLEDGILEGFPFGAPPAMDTNGAGCFDAATLAAMATPAQLDPAVYGPLAPLLQRLLASDVALRPSFAQALTDPFLAANSAWNA